MRESAAMATVLVVDDERGIREGLSRALTAHKHHAKTAATLAELDRDFKRAVDLFNKYDREETDPARKEEALWSIVRIYKSANDATNLVAAADRWRKAYGKDDGSITLWRRQGCPQCESHGYKGRMGIHELMLSDEPIRQHIRHRSSATEIRLSALAAGMKTLRQDGIEKVLQGLTDMSEVTAATNL